jgi:hypothetical protein
LIDTRAIHVTDDDDGAFAREFECGGVPNAAPRARYD